MKHLLFLLLAITFFSCGSKKTETQEETTSAETVEDEIKSIPPLYKLDPVAQQQVNDVVLAYLKLKDAFVKSDSALSIKEAQSIPAMLDAVEKKNLNADAQKDWQKYENELRKHISAIQSTESLEAQRRAFSQLSETMHTVLVAFGSGGKIYWDYCPMAFHDEGAYWLSNTDEINNPYFGDEMLHCGRVKEIFE